MRSLRLVLTSSILLIALLASAACSGSPSASADQTAGQLAEQGKVVFEPHCSKCHGAEGQGITAPAIIGSANNLANYQNGKGLYDFISTLMPNDKPGSLTPQQYLDVESYLLLQNQFVQANTPISPATLASISLTK
jgi:mono/diheme cytochrome c family protein